MGEQRISLNTRVPVTQKEALDEFCQMHKISLQDVVTQALDAFFSNKAGEHPAYSGNIELVRDCVKTIFEKYSDVFNSLETARTLGSAEQRKAVEVLSTSNNELRQQLSVEGPGDGYGHRDAEGILLYDDDFHLLAEGVDDLIQDGLPTAECHVFLRPVEHPEDPVRVVLDMEAVRLRYALLPEHFRRFH